METKQMKLTKKILKEMIEEVMLHEYGPPSARLRAENKQTPASARANLLSIVSFHAENKKETKLFRDIKAYLAKVFEGKRVLTALKKIKVPKEARDTSGVLEIFVALFHLVRAREEAQGKELKYGIDTSDYGNTWNQVVDKMDKDDQDILREVVINVGLIKFARKHYKSAFRKGSKGSSRVKRRRRSMPKRRSRFKDKSYVIAVQEIVNHYITTGKLNIPKLVVDASYGFKTRKGVEAFQKAFNIEPADGYFGPGTACAFSKALGMLQNNNCRKPQFIIRLAKKLRELKKAPKKTEPTFKKTSKKIDPTTGKPYVSDPKAGAASMKVPYLPGGNELSIAYANKRK